MERRPPESDGRWERKGHEDWGGGGCPTLKGKLGPSVLAERPGPRGARSGGGTCWSGRSGMRGVVVVGAGSSAGRQEARVGGGSRGRGVGAGGGDDPFPGHRGPRVCSRLGGEGGGGAVRWAQAQREAGPVPEPGGGGSTLREGPAGSDPPRRPGRAVWTAPGSVITLPP